MSVTLSEINTPVVGATGFDGGDGGSASNTSISNDDLTAAAALAPDNALTPSATGGDSDTVTPGYTGNGGNGGSATVTLTSDSFGTATTPAATRLSLSATAQGGAGGNAGSAGTPGAGGSASAKISGFSGYSAQDIAISVTANGGAAGTAGPAAVGAAGASFAYLLGATLSGTQVSASVEAGPQSLGATNGNSLEEVISDTITAANVSLTVGYSGAIFIENNAIVAGQSFGLTIGNFAGRDESTPVFSGNNFIGGGAATFDLTLGGGLYASIDTLAGDMGIDRPASTDNTITGFTTFQVSQLLNFTVGAGSYTVTEEAAGGSITYTPSSGNVLVNNVSLYATTLDINGFNPELTPSVLAADTTTDGTNTFIKIAGAGGTIELANYTGPVTANITAATACYRRGTHILTARGQVRIEHLSIGDRVITANGMVRNVTWLGHRGLDLARHPEPEAVWPIIVQQDAFAPGRPARDLWLSPGHNVAIDGMLMPIFVLQNGQTIRQVKTDRVEYWHVELDAHDIIFAENLPAETYLDTGNRTAFVNGGDFIEAHPDFRPKHPADTCLPIVRDGAAVARTKAELLARVAALGHVTTADHDLHIVADGQRFEPVRLDAHRFGFLLPAARHDITLRSRHFSPAHTNPASDDARQLGVCVGRLHIDGVTIDLPTPTPGWYAGEISAEHARLRWTNGHAALPGKGRLIVVELGGSGVYWAEPAPPSSGRLTAAHPAALRKGQC